MKKPNIRDVFFGLIVTIFLCLIGWLFFNVVIKSFYLNNDNAQDIQNIISLLSFFATAFVGWFMYKIEKAQKNFNEKSLTEHQRDFLRESFREFCFYTKVYFNVDAHHDSEFKIKGYEADIDLTRRIKNWIRNIDETEYSYFDLYCKATHQSNCDINSKHAKEHEVSDLQDIISQRPNYTLCKNGPNSKVFFALEDKAAEIEVMMGEKGGVEISNLWRKHVIDKFDFLEKKIFDTIEKNKSLIDKAEGRICNDKLLMNGLINKVLNEYKNKARIIDYENAEKEAKEVYKKYLSNTHVVEEEGLY